MADQSTVDIDVDIIIIGGGLAGLTAANTLLKHGMKVVVVEAEDRIGGQILTKELQCANGKTDMWDLGSTWVHKDQKEMSTLLKELKLQTYPQYESDKKYMELIDGKVKSYTGDNMPIGITAKLDLYKYFNKAQSVCDSIHLDCPHLTPGVTELETTSVETFRKQTLWTKGGADIVDMMLVLNHMRAPSHVSKMEYLYVMKSCGGYEAQLGGDGADLKIKGGASQIIQRLQMNIGADNIHTGQRVTGVSQEGQERALVTTDGGKELSAKHVIIALPLNNIVDIEFHPTLAIKNPSLPYSLGVICFVITYEKSFWRDAGFSGELLSLPGFLSQIRELPDASPLMMVLDSESGNGNPALIGTMAVGKLKNSTWVMETLKNTEERKTFVLKKLSEVFGQQASQAIDYADNIWKPKDGTKEISGFSDAVAFFSQSCGRVHWAVTELSSSWASTMNGAVHSGICAAEEVVQQLKPSLDVP